MYKFLLEFELPVMIVLSKIDKLRQSEIQKTINKAKNDFF
jgi:GTP-binding protein EngB required for normal cell division